MPQHEYDQRALAVARKVHRRENPLATILFGSRARGDFRERDSDIDIMLVCHNRPDLEYRELAGEWAEEVAHTEYGNPVPVQLVWMSKEQFEDNQRYGNHVATRARREGRMIVREPGAFYRHWDNEETTYEYDWTDYDNRYLHAVSHLAGFRSMAAAEFPPPTDKDLLVGHQAQAALEHAMKAIIAAHRGTYREIHNIGRLLGSVRRIDPALSNFSLSISPDIYSEYAGQDEYKQEREQPKLTDQHDYFARTERDIVTLVERAAQLAPER